MSGGPRRLTVLLSGSGTNLQAILDARQRMDAEVGLVLSDVADAGGLQRARNAGVPALALVPADHAGRTPFEDAMVEAIERHRAEDFVVLAGFMRILGPRFVRRFAGRLLNIHPSLLPRHRGLDTHQRALDAGDRQHGATVHWVTEALDAGPTIAQRTLDIEPGDDAESLRRRVQRLEHQLYPEVLRRLCGARRADPLSRPRD